MLNVHPDYQDPVRLPVKFSPCFVLLVVIKCCIIGNCIRIHKKTQLSRDNRNSLFFWPVSGFRQGCFRRGCQLNQKVASVCYLVLKLGNLCYKAVGCIPKVHSYPAASSSFFHVLAIPVPSLRSWSVMVNALISFLSAAQSTLLPELLTIPATIVAQRSADTIFLFCCKILCSHYLFLESRFLL